MSASDFFPPLKSVDADKFSTLPLRGLVFVVLSGDGTIAGTAPPAFSSSTGGIAAREKEVTFSPSRFFFTGDGLPFKEGEWTLSLIISFNLRSSSASFSRLNSRLTRLTIRSSSGL